MSDAPLTPAPTAPDPLAPAEAIEARDEALDEAADPALGQETDHIVGVSFGKVTRADEALLSVVHLAQEGEVVLADAVVVSKHDNGKVHVRQTVDPTPGQSAITGSFWGLLVGAVIGGPVMIAGALVGAGGAALAAKLIDLGLDDNWIKEVGKWLDPGTSALLLLVSGDVRPALVTELSRYDGKVLYCTFPDAVRQELERGMAHGAGPGPA